MTQLELAARMGVSPRSVQNYEKPDAVIPRKSEHAIRRVLGDELAQVREMRDGGASNVTPIGIAKDRLALNPRLAGISKSEMLYELLARDELEVSDRIDSRSEEAEQRDVSGVAHDLQHVPLDIEKVAASKDQTAVDQERDQS